MDECRQIARNLHSTFHVFNLDHDRRLATWLYQRSIGNIESLTENAWASMNKLRGLLLIRSVPYEYCQKRSFVCLKQTISVKFLLCTNLPYKDKRETECLERPQIEVGHFRRRQCLPDAESVESSRAQSYATDRSSNRHFPMSFESLCSPFICYGVPTNQLRI